MDLVVYLYPIHYCRLPAVDANTDVNAVVRLQIKRLRAAKWIVAFGLGFRARIAAHDCGLTPELSRTAARNGGVVHVTMQPSREAVSA